MAQAAGFSCDYCGKFELGSKNSQSILPPGGWILVRVNTPQDRENKLDICSNECLMRLGGERWGAENEDIDWKKLVYNEYMKEYRERRKEEKKES